VALKILPKSLLNRHRLRGSRYSKRRSGELTMLEVDRRVANARSLRAL
jgi:hypothetical protein